MGIIIQNTRRKRIIMNICIGMLIILAVLTFLSKTINGLLMPKVTTTTAVKGTLQTKLETEGTIEISKKYKIISDTNWKVKKVIAKVNHQVKKGDLLFVIDSTDIEMDLKRKQLEILELENAIESQKLSYKPNQLAELENEVRKAKVDVDYSEKKLDYTKKLLDIGAEAQSNFDTAEKEYKEYLYAYQAKQRLYNDKVSEMKNEDNQLNRSIKEKIAELALKKDEYGKLKESMPADGRILSESNGIVTSIYIEAGMTTQANQTIIEIADKNSIYNAVWYMDPETASKYDIGQNISATVKGYSQIGSSKDAERVDESDNDQVIKEYDFSLRIDSKEITTEKGQIKFYAKISDEQKKKSDILLNENQKVSIKGIKNSDFYNYLIPKTCITEFGGENYVFIVHQKKGALGTENVVEQIKVEVIDEDNFNIAVRGSFRNDASIIVDTTKPLSNNMRVGLR